MDINPKLRRIKRNVGRIDYVCGYIFIFIALNGAGQYTIYGKSFLHEFIYPHKDTNTVGRACAREFMPVS